MTDLSPLDRLLEQMRGDVIALQGDRVITHYADELEAALSTIRAEQPDREIALVNAQGWDREIVRARELNDALRAARAENERLREALGRIEEKRTDWTLGTDENLVEVQDIAHAALHLTERAEGQAEPEQRRVQRGPEPEASASEQQDAAPSAPTWWRKLP